MEESSRMPGWRQNRISVALCTYNGERFLPAQLASIAEQTRLPDELVVCDDRSTDGTIAIVRQFAANASFSVKVFENERNLGYAANFEQAIRLCDTELIALSDQDDLWYPQRLERSEQELVAHPQAGLVFSDADLIDEQDRPLGKTLWQKLGFSEELQRDLLAGRFTVLAKHRFITGATMMLRASLCNRVLPIGAGWIHDEWITLITAAFADLQPISTPLIRYRLHASQQVGLQNKLQQRAQGSTRAQKHWGRLAESVKELEQLCDALSAMSPEPGRAALPLYQEHLDFLRFRASLPNSRPARLGKVLSHSSQYKVHASGAASELKDILLKKKS